MLEQMNQTEPNRSTVVTRSGKALKKLNMPMFYVFVGLAVLGIVIEQILFPNLKENFFYLAIVSLTTIFGFISVGLTLSGLRARMGRPAKIAVSVLVWGFALLDIIFLLLPSVLPGATSNDAAVDFAKPAAVSTIQPSNSNIQVANTLTGMFNNQGAEAVAGNVTIGKASDGKNVLRFENFNSANGPDLHVYLTREASPSGDAQIKSGIEIGKLKATQGSLNYELDPSIDLSQYKAVAIYCKTASVVFGYANLK
jgi:hypothetical protein